MSLNAGASIRGTVFGHFGVVPSLVAFAAEFSSLSGFVEEVGALRWQKL